MPKSQVASGLLRRAAGSEAEIEEEARRTALATFVGLDGSAGDGPNDELRKMPSGL
jgi:hypothetical protein